MGPRVPTSDPRPPGISCAGLCFPQPQPPEPPDSPAPRGDPQPARAVRALRQPGFSACGDNSGRRDLGHRDPAGRGRQTGNPDTRSRSIGGHFPSFLTRPTLCCPMRDLQALSPFLLGSSPSEDRQKCLFHFKSREPQDSLLHRGPSQPARWRDSVPWTSNRWSQSACP